MCVCLCLSGGQCHLVVSDGGIPIRRERVKEFRRDDTQPAEAGGANAGNASRRRGDGPPVDERARLCEEVQEPAEEGRVLHPLRSELCGE